MTRWLTPVILLAAISTGCAKYWTRDQGKIEDFAKDHRECLVSTGTLVVNDPSMVVPNEDAYRRCLVSRGWTRRNASWLEVPAGYYRGYEEREEFKPVRIDELPEQSAPDARPHSDLSPQPAASTIDPNDPRSIRLNRCQTIYNDPRLRKLCAERDSLSR